MYFRLFNAIGCIYFDVLSIGPIRINFDQDTIIFIQENVSESVILKMPAVLFNPKMVK